MSAGPRKGWTIGKTYSLCFHKWYWFSVSVLGSTKVGFEHPLSPWVLSCSEHEVGGGEPKELLDWVSPSPITTSSPPVPIVHVLASVLVTMGGMTGSGASIRAFRRGTQGFGDAGGLNSVHTFRCPYESCDIFVEFFPRALCINSRALWFPSAGPGVHKSLHTLCSLITNASRALVDTQGGRNPANIASAILTRNDGRPPRLIWFQCQRLLPSNGS